MVDLNELFAAIVLFVGSHLLLSSAAFRTRLLDRLGERGFRLAYSLVALVTFAWALQAYGAAPRIPLWTPVPALAWVPILIMPFAFILVVAGMSTRAATALGQEEAAKAQDPAPGILRVTRHPFLWGVVLWAVSHIIANGDSASLLLMGGFLVLALGGMHHIDQRREAKLGGAWGPMKLTTSAVPFVAIATGRTRMDWRGIGIWRPVLGLAAYVVFLYLHPLLFGVMPLPH
ncbi:MAG: NnrU family protein [Pseudomonadota bacterium]